MSMSVMNRRGTPICMMPSTNSSQVRQTGMGSMKNRKCLMKMTRKQ